MPDPISASKARPCVVDLGGRLDPPREPVEVALHGLALEHRPVIQVRAARIDVRTPPSCPRLQRAVELPGVGDRYAQIALAVLNEKRRRHVLGDEIGVKTRSPCTIGASLLVSLAIAGELTACACNLSGLSLFI